MAQLLVWGALWVLVVLAFVGFLGLVLRTRRRTTTPSSPLWRRREDLADAYDASVLPGYMAGNRQRIEHRDDTTVSRVEPPRPVGAGRVDLDSGTVHVRRDTTG